MKLDHSVRVPAKIDQVWQFLDDTHAVAACMPGAELTETLDQDNYRGQVRISIGPLAMNYNGDVAVLERDAAEHRMRVDASGRDRRGSGTARAAIDVKLSPEGEFTNIRMISDVQLTGRIASLGRGVQDVSNKLFSEFAANLADRLSGGNATPPAPAPTPAPHHSDTPTSPAPHKPVSSDDSSLKLAPLVWTITRQRFADFLERLSLRVRPKD